MVFYLGGKEKVEKFVLILTLKTRNIPLQITLLYKVNKKPVFDDFSCMAAWARSHNKNIRDL